MKINLFKYILLFLLGINFLNAETLKSHGCIQHSNYINSQDILVLKKIYHYGKYKVELKRYKVFWTGTKEHTDDDCEVYYIFEVYQQRDKKCLAFYRNDFIEVMDTPYKFPYVVMHESGISEENSITMFDFSHGFKIVQTMIGTTINYDRLKNRMSPFLWNKKNNHAFTSYSNPILVGNDGLYYMETYEPVGYAKCNACQEYEKVLYKFNGKKFKKYKTFVWDENTTQKINATIWDNEK